MLEKCVSSLSQSVYIALHYQRLMIAACLQYSNIPPPAASYFDWQASVCAFIDKMLKLKWIVLCRGYCIMFQLSAGQYQVSNTNRDLCLPSLQSKRSELLRKENFKSFQQTCYCEFDHFIMIVSTGIWH